MSGHHHNHGHHHSEPTPKTSGCGCNGGACSTLVTADPEGVKHSKILDFKGFWDYFRHMPELRIIIPGIFLLALTFFLPRFGLSETWVIVIQMLILPVAGWFVLSHGFESLFKARRLNMDVLMSFALIGAVLIGEGLEALILLVLFTLSEAIEGYTGASARKVLTEFADLAPKKALLIRDGEEKLVGVETLQVGDHILVRAGDRLPMDGTIVIGQSELNQAPITGESVWVPKTVGDEVLSGTVNGSGLLEVKVTRLVEDTTMQRIIRLVTEAQATKAKQEKFIDKFASVYTPIVMLVAILVAVIPTVFFKQALWNGPEGYGWLHRGLSLLMIGCPCALVISTPITIISGLTRAARAGVIFKGGVYLEGLSQVKAVAFDKTGTLTVGEPKVELVKAVDCKNDLEPCESCDELLALASSLEERSVHPLSHAILDKAEERGVRGRIPAAEELTVIGGRGQEGIINGKKATVGSLPLFLDEHKTPQKIVDEARKAEEVGHTTVLVCDGESVRGYLTLRDQPRAESLDVLHTLRDFDIHTVMLTGDNQGAAHYIANALGIDEVSASLLPEEKLKALELLQSKFGAVAMVGDGINDGPALAKADIGVAMGGAASGQILETADVVLMNSNLQRLPFALRLSRYTNKLIRQNIFISLGVKFAVAALAIMGLTPLWVAVMADIGISLIVTLNGLRATQFEKESL